MYRLQITNQVNVRNIQKIINCFFLIIAEKSQLAIDCDNAMNE
jgi:hypothetical protein